MSNMTQPGYDERYATPVEASRRGAHRARPNPLSTLLPVIGVAIVVVAVVLLAYKLLTGTGSPDSSDLGASDTGSTAAASVGATAASSPSGADTSGGATATATPGGQASAGASDQATPQASVSAQASTSAAAGKVDKTVVLSLYNGSTPQVPGLSRKAAAKLSAAGWRNQAEPQAWSGPALTETTIYYAKASQQATAEALAKALGTGVIQLDAAVAKKGIAVVVSNDFTP